ncbi:Ger(x)C family spore germination protein [Paenibacillaceae bacterium]|nr:Ger(x)C family spore germination protein [Paenibacillaceae bacterium]
MQYKRWLVFILIACLLTGCWDRKEINDLAIITGIGVGRTPESNELELILQFYTPVDSEGGGRSSGGGSSIARKIQGQNMTDAASRLQESTPRHLFWGHSQIFLMSEALARSGIQEPLDFMTRHPEPPERINVFICRGDLEKLLHWKPAVERDSSVMLQEIGNLDNSLQVTLLDLFKMTINPSGASILPIVEMTLESGEEFPNIIGTAILKNTRLIGVASKSQTRGIRWVTNKMDKATITLTPDSKAKNETISIYFRHINTAMEPKIVGNEWQMNIKTTATGIVLENNSKLNVTKPEHMRQLQVMAGEHIAERIMGVVHPAQQRWNTDFLGFSSAFRRQYPKIWNKNKANWDQLFPKVAVQVETDLLINHSGLTNKSAKTD